jgi:hypothetical protein
MSTRTYKDLRHARFARVSAHCACHLCQCGCCCLVSMHPLLHAHMLACCVVCPVCMQVTAYSYATILLPSLVLAPDYFQGKIPFGTLTQVRWLEHALALMGLLRLAVFFCCSAITFSTQRYIQVPLHAELHYRRLCVTAPCKLSVCAATPNRV